MGHSNEKITKAVILAGGYASRLSEEPPHSKAHGEGWHKALPGIEI